MRECEKQLLTSWTEVFLVLARSELLVVVSEVVLVVLSVVLWDGPEPFPIGFPDEFTTGQCVW